MIGGRYKALPFTMISEGGLIYMVEKILENVVNEMAPHLSQDQLEHLSNVLYVNFHGMEVQEQCTELTASGEDGDEAKICLLYTSDAADE